MIAMMKELMDKLLSAVLAFLPLSPFAHYIDALGAIPHLGYINYFIPVGTMLKIGAAWLSAITLFYLYSIILRWVKAIG